MKARTTSAALALFLASATTLATAPVVAQQPPVEQPIVEAAALGRAFASVAERVSPSVVSLRVEAVQEVPDSLFRFFAPFGGSQGGPIEPEIARGAGSGIVIRADGYILTNNHVVSRARRIEAVLQDGRRFIGTVVGTDPASDLAVVRIPARDLQVATFAGPEAARVGEWVLAIGSPYGLDYTVTAGVLSAVGRHGLGMNEIEDYLQTDASINPGNSGGPLVNLQGQVLGVNSMIVGRNTGIGFAIAGELARTVANQIIDNGRVRRAYIGVTFQELTPELASELHVEPQGALVANVVAGGPAARAGLRPGDVVVSVEGTTVRASGDLLRLVLRSSVGRTIRLGYIRDGQARETRMRTAERPSRPPDGERPRERRPETSRGSGVSLSPLSVEMRQRLQYSGTGRVVVTAVTSGSPGDRAGLREGDVVVEADRRPVAAPADLETALADGSALLRVERADGAFFTVIRLEQPPVQRAR